MARRCIFCGGGSLTKEHAWPQWILNDHGDDAITIHSHGELVRTLAGPNAAIEFKRVCGPCNTGWMSKLEDKVKPIMKPLILGQRSRLGATEQRILSAWLTKTAMVFSCTQDDVDRFFTRPEFDHCRVEAAAPASVAEVLIGNYRGAERKLFTQVLNPVGIGPHNGFETYLFTIRVARFVGQVLAIRNEPDGVNFLAKVHIGSEAGVHISPPVDPVIEWPPMASFDDGPNSLTAFAERTLGGLSIQSPPSS